MGYYTSFELDVQPWADDIIPAFRSINATAEYCLSESGSTEESAKWYDHKEDLVAFSRSYPDTLFVMSGEGEENGDMWKLYVKNGKSFYAEAIITYPEYDESLLK